MPFLVFKSTSDFPPLAALKFLLGDKTAVSILTPSDVPRKTVTVLVDDQQQPLRVSAKVQVNGSARNVKVFVTHLGPSVVQKVHALCDYTAWCDVAAQPVPEFSEQAKRRLEAPTVRIVAPRPPPPAPPPPPVVSEIRMPPQRSFGAGDPTPRPRPHGETNVPQPFRERSITALLRLTHPSWEDAEDICQEVELRLLMRTAGMVIEYVKVVNDAVSKLQMSHLVPYLTLSMDFLKRTKQRTAFKEPFYSVNCREDQLQARRRLLASLAKELKDESLAWQAEKLSSCPPRLLWQSGLEYVRSGKGLPPILLDMPRDIVTRMQAALQSSDDEDVEVVGEKTWAERDRELRAAAVFLE